MDLLYRTTSFSIMLLVLLGALTSIMVVAHASPSGPEPKNCIPNLIVSGNLTLNVCTPRVHYESGETVDTSFLLSNTGSSTLQMNSITGGVVITDRDSMPVMRLQIFECFGGFGNCLVAAHETTTIIARWNTSETFSAATVSGPYAISASFSACPTGGLCLETVDSQLKVTVALTK